MKVTFGGTRGSNPVAQPGFLDFGGETSSVLIEDEQGRRLVIDAGTGLFPIGERLREAPGDRSLTILLTHYHLDHLVGLPTLSLLYDADWQIEIVGSSGKGYSPRAMVTNLIRQPLWPVELKKMKARISFTELQGDPSVSSLLRGGFEIGWCPVNHDQASVAYRVVAPAAGEAFVFATDIEWAASSEEEKASLVRMCQTPIRAGLLVMDGHYTPEEYEGFKGWGHSTWRDAVDLARQAGVERLLLTHHSPGRDDAALTRLEAELRREMPAASLARDRMEVEVSPAAERTR